MLSPSYREDISFIPEDSQTVVEEFKIVAEEIGTVQEDARATREENIFLPEDFLLDNEFRILLISKDSDAREALPFTQLSF
ncbi:MAG: hypothetical protein HY033_04995 [Ignavibacteriae bacterium]|nr:hypothetical protein [Ignavibacteria bacterium]MBI3364247.1 hypothetical protein [Ignavibacteriota bacterium]